MIAQLPQLSPIHVIDNVAQVTAVILTFNQESVIADAVHSVLNQTIIPAEVILSDDFSTDHTYEILLEIAAQYTGKSKIIVRQNSQNYKLAKHINEVVKLATYEWITPHAGDDVCEPYNLEVFLDFQKSKNNTPFFWSNASRMTMDGIVTQTIDSDVPPSLYHGHILRNEPTGIPIPKISEQDQNSLRFICWGVGPSQFWHKSLFDYFGDLPDYVTAEDCILPFRGRLLGSIFHIPQSLVRWRKHTKENAATNEEIKNIYESRIFTYGYTTANCLINDIQTYIKRSNNQSYFLQELTLQLINTFRIEKNCYDLNIANNWLIQQDQIHENYIKELLKNIETISNERAALVENEKQFAYNIKRLENRLLANSIPIAEYTAARNTKLGKLLFKIAVKIDKILQ